MKRNGFIGLILVTVMFAAGIWSLYSNLTPMLSETEEAIADGRTLIVDGNLSAPALEKLLIEGDYLTNAGDAQAVSRWIAQRATTLGGIPNLGTLNLKPMKMSYADALASESPLLHSRIAAENSLLGVNDEVRALYTSGDVPIEVTIGDGSAKVTVSVYNPDDRSHAGGVLVKAREHYYATGEEDPDLAFQGETASRDSVIAYAMTNDAGRAVFNLPRGRYYSFIPVEEGHQFGAPRGTTSGKALGGSASYSFPRRDHTITPFDATTYSRLKEDRALTVRSPQNFRYSLLTGATIFIFGWWGFFIFLSLSHKKSGKEPDYLLPLILCILTGIGLLAMYSIANPLADRLLGMDTAWGILLGLIGMAVLSKVDIAKAYNGNSRIQQRLAEAKAEGKWWGCNLKFDFFGQSLGQLTRLTGINRLMTPTGDRLKRKGFIMPAGIGFLAAAICLMLILAFLGTGPEGSDAKVNLNLIIAFQPSEVCKYLIVIFFAAFFAENAPLIQAFSDKINSYSLKRQTTIAATILIALMILCAMYLKLLSDMGPALVVVITFIILYSVARRDMDKLIIGAVTFALTVWGAHSLTHSVSGMMIGALIWFVVWMAFFILTSKRIYESAVYLNFVVATFIFGSHIIGGSEGARLANRAALQGSGIWENTVNGGDQIAQGIWSLSTGGLTGQGLGNGYPNLVPAFHTDMVLTSIGEILGWVALVAVLLCFAILIHRCLLIGRRTGNPFAFFFIAGVALVTGVQFIIIVCGSLGLIPLTGISVPFLSFGKSSLIINMAFFGLLIALSRRRATANQVTAIRSYDGVIVAGSVIFLTGAIFLAGVLLHYQVTARDRFLVKPVLTANVSGAPIIEYNPRIALLMKKLHAGNIYDRNGVPLALASAEMLDEYTPQLLAAGANPDHIKAEKRKQKTRFYPFGNSTLFMLGNYDNRGVWNYYDNNPIGYLAENRHLSELRGFDNLHDANGNELEPLSLSTSNYRSSRFLPPQEIDATFAARYYSHPRLLGMLKSGNDTVLINRWNSEREERDMTMTLDIRLQRSLETAIADFVKKSPNLRNNKNLRVSAVVLDAAGGDLLSSANYPLPDADTIKMLADNRINIVTSYYENDPGRSAITERDLGMTFQTMPGSTAKVASAITGFMALGPDANNEGYIIYRNETVEPPGTEPFEGSPAKNRAGGRKTYIDDAIVYSSNVYFVKLIHERHLYDTLAHLYDIVGLGVDNPSGAGQVTPYFLTHDAPTPLKFFDYMRLHAENGYREYDAFNRRPHDHSSWEKNYTDRLARTETALPWGQGGLRATPLSMARIASIVANGGVLAPTRFVLSLGGEKIDAPETVRVISEASAAMLRSAMQRETAHRRLISPDLPQSMGGKTGTPERSVPAPALFGGHTKYNDAWYTCFATDASSGRRLAIAVRIERTGIGSGSTSGNAVRIMSRAIIPALRSAGYNIE